MEASAEVLLLLVTDGACRSRRHPAQAAQLALRLLCSAAAAAHGRLRWLHDTASSRSPRAGVLQRRRFAPFELAEFNRLAARLEAAAAAAGDDGPACAGAAGEALGVLKTHVVAALAASGDFVWSSSSQACVGKTLAVLLALPQAESEADARALAARLLPDALARRARELGIRLLLVDTAEAQQVVHCYYCGRSLVERKDAAQCTWCRAGRAHVDLRIEGHGLLYCYSRWICLSIVGGLQLQLTRLSSFPSRLKTQSLLLTALQKRLHVEFEDMGAVVSMDMANAAADWSVYAWPWCAGQKTSLPAAQKDRNRRSKAATWVAHLSLAEGRDDIMPECMDLIVGALPSRDEARRGLPRLKLELANVIRTEQLLDNTVGLAPLAISGWCGSRSSGSGYNAPHPWFRALLTELLAVCG